MLSPPRLIHQKNGKSHHAPLKSGGAGYRSPYLSHAKRALCHLSYAPSFFRPPVQGTRRSRNKSGTGGQSVPARDIRGNMKEETRAVISTLRTHVIPCKVCLFADASALVSQSRGARRRGSLVRRSPFRDPDPHHAHVPRNGTSTLNPKP